MALNQFVRKSVSPASKQEESNSHFPEAEKFSRPVGLEYTQRAAHGTSLKADGNASRDSGVMLSTSERETLSSLAAVQIRYNRSVEAVPYLMMLRRTDPTDMKSARLLALALIKLGNWEQAETILAEIHGHPEARNGVTSGLLSFYSSLVAYKQKKLSAAREWLQRFRTFLAGAAS